MALGLWVTEVAFSWIFQVPCRLLAWLMASRKTCSCFLVLSTAPILMILGSQPARATENQTSTASSSSRMAPRTPGEPLSAVLNSPLRSVGRAGEAPGGSANLPLRQPRHVDWGGGEGGERGREGPRKASPRPAKPSSS